MNSKKLCSCGCGQEIVWKEYHKWRPSKFINGHSSKTEEFRRKIRKTNKGGNSGSFKKGRISLLKDKTYEELYGKEKADKLKKEHSEKMKGKPSPMKGKYHFKETIEKLRQANLGKTSSKKDKTYKEIYGEKKAKEIREKLSEAMKGKNKGKKHSKETIKKISNSLRGNEKLIKARAKQILPVKDTSIEVKIQNQLREIGYEFFTHQYMKGIKHGYQCDILIPALNLVIECDGDYWHKYPIGTDIDHIRTKELIKKGFKVLRLWECEIKKMDSGELQFRILDTVGKN